MVFSKSFGKEFKQFALTADVLREEDFEPLREMVRKYILDNFDMYKIELLSEANISGEPGLKPHWDKNDAYGAYPLEKDGQPFGLNALCYICKKPLWVVSTGDQDTTLVEAEDYVDQWSHVPIKAKFRRFERESSVNRWAGNDPTRTLVALPIRSDGRVCAVLYTESDKKLPCTETAKEELQYIADGIGTLNALVQHRQSRRNDTSLAIQALKESLPQGKINIFGLTKPTVFFAYSSRADRRVVGCIKSGIDAFSDVVEHIDWSEMSESGVINQQILEAIKNAKYGICYFSEESEDEAGNVTYVDNQNVFFEAGMIYFLSHYAAFGIDDWIPIRESVSSKTPFDIRDLRILNVPRLRNGSLNEDEFVHDLQTRLTSLFRHEQKINGDTSLN